MLHPDILYPRTGNLIVTENELYKRALRWITLRANELCPEGKPRKSALVQAVRESGARLTREQLQAIWQANEAELDDTTKCPIVVVSENEYRDEIQKARKRHDIMIGRFDEDLNI